MAPRPNSDTISYRPNLLFSRFSMGSVSARQTSGFTPGRNRGTPSMVSPASSRTTPTHGWIRYVRNAVIRQAQPQGNAEQLIERLASGAEAAAVGNGDSQVLVRIDWSVVDADFVVEVRTGRASAKTNIADDIAPVDVLAGSNRVAGKVSVARANAVTMVKHHRLAVSAEEIYESDDTIGRGDHLVAVSAANIDSAVERTFTIERIDTLAKT